MSDTPKVLSEIQESQGAEADTLKAAFVEGRLTKDELDAAPPR